MGLGTDRQMKDITQLHESPGPFATVLVDVSLDREDADKEVEVRARDVTDQLTELGAPTSMSEEIRSRVVDDPVHEPAPRSRFLVSGADGILLDETLPVATPDAVVTWDRLPDLGPLLVRRAGSIPFVFVAVDHRGGSVATYDSLDLEPGETSTVASDEQHEHKVRGGGLAHKRFQRTAENLWRDNARDVAQLAIEKARQGRDLVVVAGPAESRREVVSALGKLPVSVAELDRSAGHEDGGDEALTDDVAEAVQRHEREHRARLEAEVSEGMGRRSGVAVGVDQVAESLVLGQVATLLVDFDALREETVAPSEHPGFPVAVPDGASTIRADLALVAAAHAIDSDVVPVLTPVLGEHPVVALLRWDEEEPG